MATGTRSNSKVCVRFRVALTRTLAILTLATALSGCNSKEKALLRAHIERTIDPYKLQEWAVPIIAERELYYEIPRESWPHFLLTTNGPSSAWVAGWVSTEKRAVMVSWGGGFGHRVVIVGDESFVITERELGSPVEHWIPGVFFALDAR